MTKVNLNNGMEQKSDIFPWGIFKFDSIPFLSKYINVNQWLSKSEFLSFMTKVNLNNGNGTTFSQIFPWDTFKSETFLYQNILKYFNEFQNRNFSILWLNWTQTVEIKQNQTFFQWIYSNLIFLLLVVKY